jgi:hypothetical protein
MFDSQIQKSNQIPLSYMKVKLSSLYLVIIPKDIDADCIEPKCLYHEQPMFPVLLGNPSKMYFSSSYRREFPEVVDLSISIATALFLLNYISKTLRIFHC